MSTSKVKTILILHFEIPYEIIKMNYHVAYSIFKVFNWFWFPTHRKRASTARKKDIFWIDSLS